MRIGILGLTLLALLALGASSAAAATQGEWRSNGSEIQGAPVGFRATGTIEIQELHNGKFTCSAEETGTVGAGKAGEITGDTLSSCTYTGSSHCESSIEVKALGLPWKTEVATVEGALRNEIKESSGSSPRWMLKCKGSSGLIENECTGAASTGMRNFSEGVVATYDSKSSAAHCVIGEATFSGSENVKGIESRHLSLEWTEWLINGKLVESSVAVKTKGTIKLTEPLAPIVVECATTGEDSILPSGRSEVTKLTLSSCKFNKTCIKGSTAEAHGLPWDGSLATTTETRLLLSEGGGAPGITIKCEMSILGKFTYECVGGTSTSVTTVAGGIEEAFDSHSEKLKCSLDKEKAGEATLEGAQLVESPTAGALTFRT